MTSELVESNDAGSTRVCQDFAPIGVEGCLRGHGGRVARCPNSTNVVGAYGIIGFSPGVSVRTKATLNVRYGRYDGTRTD